MNKQVSIEAVAGVELQRTDLEGVARVVVLNPEAAKSLPWDRYARLKAVADAINELTRNNSVANTVEASGIAHPSTVLDAGGFDGALALFLPGCALDLFDPATTGASVLRAPVADKSYDVVASVDVLEHIAPADRLQALSELTRIARKYVVLNYPHRDSLPAQQIAFRATGDAFVKEHVEWVLPDGSEILRFMASRGFTGSIRAHSSATVWLGQFLASHFAQNVAHELNAFLVDRHSDEANSSPLYELLVCKRNS